MKIAYVTSYNPNRSTFGGRGYYIAQSLKNQGFQLEFIGPLKTNFSHKIIFRTKELFYRNFVKKKYTRSRDRILLRNYAKQIKKKLISLDFDIVFSAISPGSQPVAYLDCNKPIVIWTDTSFAGVLNFYPSFKNLCRETIRDGINNESAALSKSNLIIYTSDWAAKKAIEYYKLDPEKVKVVPFGPYLKCNLKNSEIESIANLRLSQKICQLLFIASSWYRKGGDIAYNLVKELNKSGLPSRLVIVGCKPPQNGLIREYIQVIGYLRSSEMEGYKQISKLFKESHFLILPTRADCAPSVIREACAFGLPSITTDVGGIATIIKDNINGKLFSLDCKIDNYVEFVISLFKNPLKYKKFIFSTYNEYRTRLNWNTAGKAVKNLIEERFKNKII